MEDIPSLAIKQYIHHQGIHKEIILAKKIVVKYVNKISDFCVFFFFFDTGNCDKAKTHTLHILRFDFVVCFVLLCSSRTFSFHIKTITELLFQSSRQTYHDKYICVYIYIILLNYFVFIIFVCHSSFIYFLLYKREGKGRIGQTERQR